MTKSLGFAYGSMRKIAQEMGIEDREDIILNIIWNEIKEVENIFFRPLWDLEEIGIEQFLDNSFYKMSEEFDKAIERIKYDLELEGVNIDSNEFDEIKQEYLYQVKQEAKEAIQNFVRGTSIPAYFKDRVKEHIVQKVKQ